MARSCYLLNHVHVKGKTQVSYQKNYTPVRVSASTTDRLLGATASPNIELIASKVLSGESSYHFSTPQISEITSNVVRSLLLADLDPATAKLAISILGPFLSAFGFLFILRIVMSWYPKLPVEKFPYVVAYAPTEPLLIATRKVIPPLAGVDVTPVVWFGLLSFLNEILVGPQGLLVLVSQQQDLQSLISKKDAFTLSVSIPQKNIDM